MERKVEVRCPYCGTAVYVHHESLFNAVYAVVCDEYEFNGCGKPFAAFVSVDISVVGVGLKGKGR